MAELIKFISETGILIVIAGVFIWDKISNSKTVNTLLIEIRDSTKALHTSMASITAAIDNTRVAIDNTTTALNMVEVTQKNMSEDLTRHDKRSEFMNTDIKKILEHVRKEK